jgi:hypothetical protein
VLVQGVDERRIVHQLDALVPGQHVGQIGGRIARELQGRALGDVQLGAALQVDRAGQPDPGRNDDPAAASLGGRGEAAAIALVQSTSPPGRRRTGDREVAARDGRRLDPARMASASFQPSSFSGAAAARVGRPASRALEAIRADGAWSGSSAMFLTAKGSGSRPPRQVQRTWSGWPSLRSAARTKASSLSNWASFSGAPTASAD